MSVSIPARRRWLPAVMLASAALAAASCAAQANARAPGANPAGSGAGRLVIKQVRAGTAIPVEGAFSYIRIERASGAVVVSRRLPGSLRLTVPLRPGAYRLVSWQRTCDGNCGFLDPPSLRCASPFTVSRGERLAATIRVNYASGCLIRLGH